MNIQKDKTDYIEDSRRHGQMKELINGSDIRHLQFTEFSEGHGSVYGTLSDGRKFRMHMSEILKMVDEFDFSVYDRDMGNVLDVTLQVNWSSTENLRKQESFEHKAKCYEFLKDGNSPNKVNYVVRIGKGPNTRFIEHRTGPYYSGFLKITNPADVKEIF